MSQQTAMTHGGSNVYTQGSQEWLLDILKRAQGRGDESEIRNIVMKVAQTHDSELMRRLTEMMSGEKLTSTTHTPAETSPLPVSVTKIGTEATPSKQEVTSAPPKETIQTTNTPRMRQTPVFSGGISRDNTGEIPVHKESGVETNPSVATTETVSQTKSSDLESLRLCAEYIHTQVEQVFHGAALLGQEGGTDYLRARIALLKAEGETPERAMILFEEIRSNAKQLLGGRLDENYPEFSGLASKKVVPNSVTPEVPTVFGDTSVSPQAIHSQATTETQPPPTATLPVAPPLVSDVGAPRELTEISPPQSSQILEETIAIDPGEDPLEVISEVAEANGVCNDLPLDIECFDVVNAYVALHKAELVPGASFSKENVVSALFALRGEIETHMREQKKKMARPQQLEKTNQDRVIPPTSKKTERVENVSEMSVSRQPIPSGTYEGDQSATNIELLNPSKLVGKNAPPVEAEVVPQESSQKKSKFGLVDEEVMKELDDDIPQPLSSPELQKNQMPPPPLTKANAPKLVDSMRQSGVQSVAPLEGYAATQERNNNQSTSLGTTDTSIGEAKPGEVKNVPQSPRTNVEMTHPPRENEKAVVGDPLMSEKITKNLQEGILRHITSFQSSGILGIGKKLGLEHPVYKKLANVPIELIQMGRVEGVDNKLVAELGDYIIGWQKDPGVLPKPGDTLDLYLRRVVMTILEKNGS